MMEQYLIPKTENGSIRKSDEDSIRESASAVPVKIDNRCLAIICINIA